MTAQIDKLVLRYTNHDEYLNCYWTDGLTRVRCNGKSGFINKYGHEVIKCQYEDCYDFMEGLAAAKKNGKWGFIDTIGNLVIDFTYDDIVYYGFSDGFAGVKKDGKFGLIDKNGNVVIPFVYDGILDFNRCYVNVMRDGF